MQKFVFCLTKQNANNNTFLSSVSPIKSSGRVSSMVEPKPSSKRISRRLRMSRKLKVIKDLRTLVVPCG